MRSKTIVTPGKVEANSMNIVWLISFGCTTANFVARQVLGPMDFLRRRHHAVSPENSLKAWGVCWRMLDVGWSCCFVWLMSFILTFVRLDRLEDVACFWDCELGSLWIESHCHSMGCWEPYERTQVWASCIIPTSSKEVASPVVDSQSIMRKCRRECHWSQARNNTQNKQNN